MRSLFSRLRPSTTEPRSGLRGRPLAVLAALAIVATTLLAVPVVVDALTSPRTWVDEPKENSTATGDLTVQGSARHGKGVAIIQLVIKNHDDNTYWNGSGWQSRFVRFDVEVDDPGATRTGWSYTLAAEHLKEGDYRARAFARSVEGNGDASGGDLNDFRYIPDLDPELYDTEIVAPVDGSSMVGAITIEGRARSTEGVAEVLVALRNTDHNQYWDAESGRWTSDYVRVRADLTNPGGTTTDWTVAVPADQSIDGVYATRAWVVTGTGKGDPFGRGRATFTVGDGSPIEPIDPPNPIMPSPTVAPPTTAPPTTAPPTTTPGGDRVVWEDNFDSFDSSRWSREHSTYGDGNNELQCYRPENVWVADGNLVLRAVNESYTCPNGSTRQVTSGMVRSRGVTFEPGQVLEFRVKLNPADTNNQEGLWPAVWSSGWAGGGWPNGGEIDYLEVMTANHPNRSVYTIHYAKPGGSHGKTGRQVFDDKPFSAEWHTIRFDYGQDGALSWYLDGEHVNTVNDADTAQGWPAPFNAAIGEIKINLALGGDPGPLDPRALGDDGATFLVDYIRVTEEGEGPAPEPPTTTTTQPEPPSTTTTRPTTTTTRPEPPTTRPPTTRPPSDDCPGGDPSILLPCEGVLIGASGDFRADDGSLQPKQDHFTEMERRLGADFDIFHNFLQWNDLVSKQWPNDRDQAIADDGHILLTNWKSPTGRVTDWARIADGEYDADIRAAARQVAAFGEPTFLTFFHEPEDNIRDAANGNATLEQRYIGDYRAAFRHIHDVFEANGADNAIWVWDMQGWLGGFERYYESGLYPGDDVVDWVAWNPYNWFGCENHGNSQRWKSFTDVVAPFYDWLEAGGPGRPSTDKPLMLGEWGTEENTGATDSDQTKAEWLDEARRVLPTRFPRLRAVVYFDTEGRRADGSVQFCEWGIDSSSSSIDAMRRLVTDASLNPRW